MQRFKHVSKTHKKKKPNGKGQAFSVCSQVYEGKMNMESNLSQHPCTNKCNEFTEEQCGHCLISESDFMAGDTVVFIDESKPGKLMTVHKVQGNGVLLDGNRSFALIHLIRHANVQELNAKRRLTLTEQALAEVP